MDRNQPRPASLPEPRTGLSRRATLQRVALGTAGVAAGAAMLPASADAATGTGPFIVVDAGGNGDYTNVEEAVASAPPGSLIYVKQGTYTIVWGDMNPAEGVRVCGEGYGTHLIAQTNLQGNIFSITNTHVVIEHLRLDGNAANQSGTVNCLYFTSSYGKVLDCWVHDAQGYNIVGFPGASYWLIQGNHSYSTSNNQSYPSEGIELQGVSFFSVLNNTVWGVRENGIILWNSSGDCHHNAVVGNTISGCGVAGIDLEDAAHDNVIVGNTCYQNARGIFAHDNSQSGLVKNNTISGNVCTQSGGWGIQVTGLSDCVLNDNTVTDNGAWGFCIQQARACSFSGNVVTRNQRAGFWFNDSSDCVVSGNVCNDNGQASWAGNLRSGIVLQQSSGSCSNNVVTNNRCLNTQGSTQLYGIALLGNAWPNMLSENVLDGNATSGMLIPAGARIDASAYRKVSATVGTSKRAVAHGLPHTPNAVSLTPTSAGQVWQAAPPDATNVYLQASGGNTTVDVYVG